MKPAPEDRRSQYEQDLALIQSVRTYRIVRCNRRPLEVVESGIVGFLAADARAAELQKQYDATNPTKTTWTKDLFHVELELRDEILAALGRMRIRRNEGEVA